MFPNIWLCYKKKGMCMVLCIYLTIILLALGHVLLCRTEIEWYSGKCLTPNLFKTNNWESFFNFFSPPQIPKVVDENVVRWSSLLCVFWLFVMSYLFLFLYRPKKSKTRWNKIMRLGELIIYHLPLFTFLDWLLKWSFQVTLVWRMMCSFKFS